MFYGALICDVGNLHNLWTSIIKLAITFRICRHCWNGALGHITHCSLQLVELIRNWTAGLQGSHVSSELSLGSMAIGKRKKLQLQPVICSFVRKR